MARILPTGCITLVLIILASAPTDYLITSGNSMASDMGVGNIMTMIASDTGAPHPPDRTSSVMANAAPPAVAPAAAETAAAPAPPFFPEVTGDNLEGKRFRLPADFEGTRNVVLIAFEREQQAQVDTWIPALRQLVAEQADLRYYELPTIKEMSRVMRWVINGGMARGIDDPKARAATITLYIDKEPFTRALGIATEQVISLVVVDRSGRIDWQTVGTYTPEKERALREVLAGR